MRPGDDPVVDPGELLPAVVRALLDAVPTAGSMIRRSRVTGPCAAQSLEASKDSLYWHTSTTTRPLSSS
jgi:hypothetical protein